MENRLHKHASVRNHLGVSDPTLGYREMEQHSLEIWQPYFLCVISSSPREEIQSPIWFYTAHTANEVTESFGSLLTSENLAQGG